MRHEQYRDGLLRRLGDWKCQQPDGTIAQARAELRATITDAEIDLLFDNWLNANFDRVEVKQISAGVSAPVFVGKTPRSPEEKIAAKAELAKLQQKAVGQLRDNLFEEFAARIWQTPLPNGILLLNATGKDLKAAGSWYAQLAKSLKPNEKLDGKVTTRQLYRLAYPKTALGKVLAAKPPVK